MAETSANVCAMNAINVNSIDDADEAAKNSSINSNKGITMPEATAVMTQVDMQVDIEFF